MSYKICTLFLFIFICVFFLYKDKKEMTSNQYRVIGEYRDTKSYQFIDHNNDNKYRKHKNYIKFDDDDDIYTGIKWECVEFIRRFFIKNYLLTFRSVKNAFDMTSLTYFYSIIDDSVIHVQFIRYSRRNILSIQTNDIVIFSYKNTGHVALVTNVLSKQNQFEIVEQNWEKEWESSHFSRRIDLYDPNIIGWLRLL